jgi:hypothetical protein
LEIHLVITNQPESNMGRYTTVEQLIEEGESETLIDVTLRRNGRLHTVIPALYFDEAVEHVRTALESGMEVECDEHDPREGAQYDLLHGQLDFQE